MTVRLVPSSMDTTPFPEPDSPELERYTLYARTEMVSLLNRLCEERSMTTVYVNRDCEFSVSVPLRVDPERDEVIFDMPSDPHAQQRLLAAESLLFVAFIDSVKLQFKGASPQALQFDGYPAFRVPLPTQMLRLQRREFYRVRTPPTRPATCLVPQEYGASKYESLRVLDISVGGLAVLTYPYHFELPVGTTIDNCYLDLPGVAAVTVKLRVVHVDQNRNSEPPARRCGCEFVDMAPQARMSLQRYVYRVDAEQRKESGPRHAA